MEGFDDHSYYIEIPVYRKPCIWTDLIIRWGRTSETRGLFRCAMCFRSFLSCQNPINCNMGQTNMFLDNFFCFPNFPNSLVGSAPPVRILQTGSVETRWMRVAWTSAQCTAYGVDLGASQVVDVTDLFTRLAQIWRYSKSIYFEFQRTGFQRTGRSLLSIGRSLLSNAMAFPSIERSDEWAFRWVETSVQFSATRRTSCTSRV